MQGSEVAALHFSIFLKVTFIRLWQLCIPQPEYALWQYDSGAHISLFFWDTSSLPPGAEVACLAGGQVNVVAVAHFGFFPSFNSGKQDTFKLVNIFFFP